MGKEIFKDIKYIADCLLNIIFPEPLCCTYCGRVLKDEGKYSLCASCLSQVERHDNSYNTINNITAVDESPIYFDDLISVCDYSGFTREMVHKLKYNDKRKIAVTMGAMIDEELKKRGIVYDGLIPIPIHKRRYKKRGYNQSELIAREISNLNGLPVLSCVERVKDTKSQVLLNEYMRWYNVKDAFLCNIKLDNKTVVIIDDVITTGATINFCAKAVKDCGAKKVIAVAFAK